MKDVMYHFGTFHFSAVFINCNVAYTISQNHDLHTEMKHRLKIYNIQLIDDAKNHHQIYHIPNKVT